MATIIIPYMVTTLTCSCDAGPVALPLRVKHVVSFSVLSTDKVADILTSARGCIECPFSLNSKTNWLRAWWVDWLDALT